VWHLGPLHLQTGPNRHGDSEPTDRSDGRGCGMSQTPTTPPVKASEEYFNSTRLKVIGLITAATVAVGALGGIAGVAFDPDPVGKDNVVQPGGDGTRLAPVVDPGSPGNTSPQASRSKATLRTFPGSDDSPSSVGSASPSLGGATSSPTDEPSDLTESPIESPTESPIEPTESPTDNGDNGDNGDAGGVTIPATGVDIYVPSGWHVDFQDDNRVFQSNDSGSYSFAFSFVDDPSVAAGDVITQNLQNLLPAENYTQLQTSDVVPLEPFGSVVSLAGIEYEALWVDNQGSISIHGQIYVGVRQDGTVLGILVEHIPAEDFEAAFEGMVPILNNSYGRFGGLG
jgi:hypothetical protein